jgi:hypothetical protein
MNIPLVKQIGSASTKQDTCPQHKNIHVHLTQRKKIALSSDISYHHHEYGDKKNP